MAIALVILGSLLAGLIAFLSYKIGRYKEARQMGASYVKDVDSYLEKINAADNKRIDDYSKSDILSGKVLRPDKGTRTGGDEKSNS